MPNGTWGINMNIISLPNYIKCGDWKPFENKELIQEVINYKFLNINKEKLTYINYND